MKPVPGSESLPPPGAIRSQVSPALKPGSGEQRSRVVPIDDEDRSPVLVEVDLTRDPDTEQTRTAFLGLYQRVFPGRPQPIRVAASYLPSHRRSRPNWPRSPRFWSNNRRKPSS
ncbi:hypothetical protein [Kitasatospora sp. NPDC051914]|uniref:hypothetical protein n=1 Tax=Kitasatospora sp. NPDC051914 TaxID=3154945 RepID=UPI00343A2586